MERRLFSDVDPPQPSKRLLKGMAGSESGTSSSIRPRLQQGRLWPRGRPTGGSGGGSRGSVNALSRTSGRKRGEATVLARLDPPLVGELQEVCFGTVLADPPWRFMNRTGKVAPEHRRLSRYDTMTVEEIAALPVAEIAAPVAHLYLWVPNALLPCGLQVMAAWGFQYKTTINWRKIRKDGG